MAATPDGGPAPELGARAVIGVPLHDAGPGLVAALEDLLAQRARAFAVVVVDDRSSDGSAETAEDVAARDERVAVVRNARRLGLGGNWRATFAEARRRHPDAAYFAWAGDHDRRAPAWLASLTAALEANPRAVLAHPLDARIDVEGRPVPGAAPPLSTSGVRSPLRRLWRTSAGMAAGSLVYGLVRVDALEAAGVFDLVLRPDRLLLGKLALLGETEQVPEVLWQRRITARPTGRRQRRAMFPDGAPAASRVPWQVVHGAALTSFVARGRVPGLPRAAAPLAAGAYLVPLLGRDVRQRVLEAAFWLEGRLPRRLTGALRRAAGLAPRRDPWRP